MGDMATQRVETAPGDVFCRGYRTVRGVFDEMTDAQGVRRGHWHALLTAMDRMRPDELPRRWEAAGRLIHEHGVTYNVYGDPQGMDRPWALDPLPLVIDPADWRRIEAGLVQRATLLNLIIADLYGPQRLLHDGLLPPELVFAHPGFLRPCHGIPVPGAAHLVQYAADLARSPDGQWWVLGDRVQAPSGAGYALENRIVVSRTLPEAFRDCNVQRLATYFGKLRETLRDLAPRGRNDPKIVLLTPGPFNETYFEHAYLARYLGYTLVEGGDLTFRDNKIYLKTLGGLVQVDVIIRRMDDDFCDPLDLRPDSTLGIPGLVQAAHAGHVTIANALGSGVVESPALMAFLPGLCRHLLGEELQLPSVATWWCGQQRERREVTARIDRLVVKPAFGALGSDPHFGDMLSDAERHKLIARIEARPHHWIAQERVPLSTAPVWRGGKVEPRHVVLRTYVVRCDDSYSAMPGGLTRTSISAESLVVSMQRGGGSKDTWVLADGPVSSFSLLEPEHSAVTVVRRGAELPSRVADNLYWLGRYVERAEDTVRLFRAILDRLTIDSLGGTPELPVLLAAAQAMGVGSFGDDMHHAALPLTDPLRLEDRIRTLLLDREHYTSLRATLDRAFNLASVVRDRISLDAWRIINQLHLDVREVSTAQGDRPVVGEVATLLNRLVITLSAFSGLGMESMTRGQGWRFLDIGRRIERGVHTIRLVASALGRTHPHEPSVLEAILEVADSSMTYRSRYQTTLRVAAVLDLLLIDETNPRSLAFQMAALLNHVENLPNALGGGPGSASRSEEQQLVLAALTDLRVSDPRQLAAVDDDGFRRGLAFVLNNLASRLPRLSDALARTYLSHAASSPMVSVGERADRRGGAA